MRRALATCAFLVGLPACCVNPFIGTDTHLPPNAPGSPERETRGSLAEHPPAVQPGSAASEGVGAGFDMRLVRVQPGVHLGTEQSCDISATGRLELLGEGDEALLNRYPDGTTQRMSIQCTAQSGEGWADLAFRATNVSHAPDVQAGTRVRVRVHRADGGFSDYPIVDFVAVEGNAPERAGIGARVGSGVAPTLATGFDLRQILADPALLGSTQSCVVSHVDDIDILDASDVRRRSYPAGVQNRMTIRCRHVGGEEWADLVFMPQQARSALHVRRGDSIPVTIVARNGGFFDYPVLQFAGE